MGLIVNVYRQAGFNPTNSRVPSNACNRFTLTNVDGPFEPSDTAPAARLLPGYAPRTARIVPDQVAASYPMFGGNYANGDDRLAAAVERLTGIHHFLPIPIHDLVDG